MPNHGGKRPGAGRKPLIEGAARVSHTLSATAEDWALLLKIGKGSYSRGLRLILQAVRENQPEHNFSIDTGQFALYNSDS
jgi:hypothetical protein